MDSLDPSVLLDKSHSHTITGQTGSIGVELFEVGVGFGRMRGRTGYVPWPIMVGGLSLSAVPLQASYHGTTTWQLNTGNIRLAEAFISFNGAIVYGFLCASVPLKHSTEYQQLLRALDLLSQLIPDVRAAYTWLKARSESNSVELRVEGALCGGRVAHRDIKLRDQFSWSTPQASVGFTNITFAGVEPLRAMLHAVTIADQVTEAGSDAGQWVMRQIRKIF